MVVVVVVVVVVVILVVVVVVVVVVVEEEEKEVAVVLVVVAILFTSPCKISWPPHIFALSDGQAMKKWVIEKHVKVFSLSTVRILTNAKLSGSHVVSIDCTFQGILKCHLILINLCF